MLPGHNPPSPESKAPPSFQCAALASDVVWVCIRRLDSVGSRSFRVGCRGNLEPWRRRVYTRGIKWRRRVCVCRIKWIWKVYMHGIKWRQRVYARGIKLCPLGSWGEGTVPCSLPGQQCPRPLIQSHRFPPARLLRCLTLSQTHRRPEQT